MAPIGAGPDWRRKTVEEIEALFAELGLHVTVFGVCAER